jgi:hypothetical protein
MTSNVKGTVDGGKGTVDGSVVLQESARESLCSGTAASCVPTWRQLMRILGSIVFPPLTLMVLFDPKIPDRDRKCSFRLDWTGTSRTSPSASRHHRQTIRPSIFQIDLVEMPSRLRPQARLRRSAAIIGLVDVIYPLLEMSRCASRKHDVDGGEQIGSDGPFEDISIGSRFDRPELRILFLVDAECDQLQSREMAPDSAN